MPNKFCEICQNPIDSGGDYYSPFCEPCQNDLCLLEKDLITNDDLEFNAMVSEAIGILT
jgi:hypothetical protein